MAGDTIGLIEQLRLGPSGLLGLSLRGFIVEEVCWSRPDLVRQAVLIACTGTTAAYMKPKARTRPRFSLPGRCPALTTTSTPCRSACPQRCFRNHDETGQLWAELLATGTGFPSETGRPGHYAAARLAT
jgi:pimeloyl-ACP methyl ester carboxylesterase